MIKLIFWLPVLLLILFEAQCAFSQGVEHNFIVGPQEVTCDSLKLDGVSQEIGIEKIRVAKFRFQQSFKLTRKSGLQLGEYYSCGDLLGYLIIKYNDTSYLYQDVEKTLWDQLVSSADPEGVYLKAKDALSEFL